MIRQAYQQTPPAAGRSPGQIVNPTAYDRFPTPQRQAWLSSLQSKINRGLNGLPPTPGSSRSPSPIQDEAGPSSRSLEEEDELDRYASSLEPLEENIRLSKRDQEQDDNDDGWPEVGSDEEEGPWPDQQQGLEELEDDELGDEAVDADTRDHRQQSASGYWDEADEGSSDLGEDDRPLELADEEDELDREIPEDEEEVEYDEELEDKYRRRPVDAESESGTESDEAIEPEPDEGDVWVRHYTEFEEEAVVGEPQAAITPVDMAQVGTPGFGIPPEFSTNAMPPLPSTSLYPPLPQQTPLDALLSSVNPDLLPFQTAAQPASSNLSDMAQIDPQLLAELVQQVSDQNMAWSGSPFTAPDPVTQPPDFAPFDTAVQVPEVAASENPFASFVLPAPSPVPMPPQQLPPTSANMSREASGSGSHREVIEFIDSDDEELEEPVEGDDEAEETVEEEESETEPEEEEEEEEDDEMAGPVVVAELEDDEEMLEPDEGGRNINGEELDDDEELDEGSDGDERLEEDAPSATSRIEPPKSATSPQNSAPVGLPSAPDPPSDATNSRSTRASDDDHLPFLLRKGNLKSPLDRTHALPVLEHANAAYNASWADSQGPAAKDKAPPVDIAAHITSPKADAHGALPTNIPFGNLLPASPWAEKLVTEPGAAPTGLLSIPTDTEEAEQVDDLAEGPVGDEMTRESSPTPPPLPHLPDFSLPEDVEMRVDELTIPAPPGTSFGTDAPLHEQDLETTAPLVSVDAPIDAAALLPDPYAPPPATVMLSPLDPHHLLPHPEPTPSLIVEPPQNPPSPASIQPTVARAESPIAFPNPYAPPPDNTRPMPLSPGDMGINKALTPSLIVEAPQHTEDPVLDDVLVSALPTPALDDSAPPFAEDDQPVTVITPGLELRMEAFDSEIDQPVITEMGEDINDDTMPNSEDRTPIGENPGSEVEVEEPVEDDQVGIVEEVEPEEPVEIAESADEAGLLDAPAEGSRRGSQEEEYAEAYVRLRHRHGTHDHTDELQQQLGATPGALSPPITRSHCFYTKLRIRDGDDFAVVLAPQCVIGDVQKLSIEHAESEGIATDDEEQLARTQVITHSNPLLSAALATKLHRIVGEKLFDAGHCYLLEASSGARRVRGNTPPKLDEAADEDLLTGEKPRTPKPAASSQHHTRSSARLAQATLADSLAAETPSQPTPASPATGTRGKGRTASKSVEFDLPSESPPPTPSARGRGRGRGRPKQSGSTRSASIASLPLASVDAVETLPTISESQERRRSLRSTSRVDVAAPPGEQGDEDAVARHTRSSTTPLVPPLALDTPAQEVDKIVTIEESAADAPPQASEAEAVMPEAQSSQIQTRRRSARRSHADAVDEAPYRPATPEEDEEQDIAAAPKSPRSPRKPNSKRKEIVTPIKAVDFAEAPASRTRKRKYEAEQELAADGDVDMEASASAAEPAKRETRSAKKRAVEQDAAPDVPVAESQAEPEATKADDKPTKPKSAGKKGAEPEPAKAPETPQRKTRSWLSSLFSSKK